MDEIPTYTIYTPGSEGEAALLSVHGLNQRKLNKAIKAYAKREDATIGTLLGISVDGVVYTPEKDWSRDNAEGLTTIKIIPWPQLINPLPKGSGGAS